MVRAITPHFLHPDATHDETMDGPDAEATTDDNAGRTCLMSLAAKPLSSVRQMELVATALLDAKANPDACAADGRSVLDHAVGADAREVLERILRQVRSDDEECRDIHAKS